MKISFFGGVGGVTGSNYLVEFGGTRILVDCGLHQESSFCERHNWNPFPYDPASIDAVFATHAHIDHTGRIPKLVREGFHGSIYSTPPTREAAELLLLDSDHVLAEDAERFNLPVLFTEAHVRRALSLWRTLSYHVPLEIGGGRVTLGNTAHILGSAFVTVEAEGKRAVFSSDLGNAPSPLIGSPEIPRGTVDRCIVESTYGDRIHEDASRRREILQHAVTDTVHRGGTLMIPAFAMERTQEILFELAGLVAARRIPKIPIYLDSPLAIRLTDVYRRYDDYLVHAPGASRASAHHLFDIPGLVETLAREDSKRINEAQGTKVVIAGSGMMHGGRILHHARRYLRDPNSMLLIVGYQAAHSLGRRILDRAPSVRIFGEEIPVRCAVQAIGGYSAHADQSQILDWLRGIPSLRSVSVVHGEPQVAGMLAEKIARGATPRVHVPREGESVIV
jgi:metallo-beta-lactamase family protein